MEEKEDTVQSKMPPGYIITSSVFLVLGLLLMLWAYIPGGNILAYLSHSVATSSSASSSSSAGGAIVSSVGIAIVGAMMIVCYVFLPSYLAIIGSAVFGIASFVKHRNSSNNKERGFLLGLGIGHSVIVLLAVIRLILYYTIAF